MHWWNSRSPSSSSSSPKSSVDSPSSPSRQRRPFRDINFFKNRRGNSAVDSTTRQPRLTRQRKLRHLSDLEIRRVAGNFTSDSTSVSRSSSNLDRNSSRSSLVLPLPLPELSTLLQRDSGPFSPFSGLSSGCCPLPSPRDVFCRGDSDEVDAVCGYVTDSSNGDGGFVEEGFELRQQNRHGDRSLPGFDAGRLPGQTVHRTTEHNETPSPGSPMESARKSLQVPNFSQNIRNDFRKSIAAKSAPTSCFSSPMLSPRRSSYGDFFASSTPSQGLDIWSAADIPFPGPEMITGTSAHASQEKVIASPDWSALHSPSVRSSGLKSNVPSASASPLHPKMSSDSSGAWHESGGNVTVHPLPLPPGAAVSLLSPLVHQAPAKPEPSSMTGQWQKGKLIGSGTYGHVFVATNRKTGALCAMKEVSLIPGDSKSAECMKQLEQEIKVLGQLKHPNIVQYYGSEIIEDRFYIYLEYVYPGSINKYIQDHVGAMTESVVRNFTRHILLGLAYLHSTKTVHRDIKGANLLVDASGVVKLADFGMAKHLNGPASVLSLKGTPHWMAPEVIVHQERGYDLAVDIWSLGCTIIEMFTGKPPWSEFEGAAAMFKVCKNESPPIPYNLSADGKDFLHRCFRRNPADRPTATMLLKHPFIEEIPSCIQSFSGMKLQEIAQGPTERTNHTTDPMCVSQPHGMHTTKVKQFPQSENGQSHLETSKSAAKTNHSPRSTLEALPSLSPPHSNNITSNFGPSNLKNGIYLGSGYDHLYALPKSRRKELFGLF